MRFVVMGGGGFVGSHLSERLLDAGNKVTVFDRPQSRYLDYLQQKGATICAGDFLNSKDISRVMIDCDVVFHLISTTVPKTSNDNPLYDVDTNVLGTLRLLEEARKAKVRKVVFASSGGTVYGIPQKIPITETHPTDPISSYGISKLMTEKYLHLYWTLYQLDYCILRIANAYGERQPITESQGVISAFLDKTLKHEKMVIWGDGTIVRDYIHAEDIVSALVQAAYHEGDLKIFNIGGGQGHNLRDIIGMIEKITRESVQPVYNLPRPFDVQMNVLDISRAKEYLKWQPTIGLFEGLSRTYKWMLKERNY